MATMPMFPLTQPLLPGALLPLNVFEPRYRAMFQAILADDEHPPEFGVTMIERGFEVGGGEERTDLGTVARILDMDVTPDGRYSVIAVGAERLRVRAWLPDDPYPRADVERWPDEGEAGVDPAEIDSLRERVATINERVRALGEDAPAADTEISDDPHLAVYHLAALAPLGPADRHKLLAAPGLSERVAVLSSALDDVAAVIEFRLA